MDESLEEAGEARPAKREARSVRQSSTSAALKHILAGSADTPPTKSVPLTSKPVNSQPVTSTSSSKITTEKEEASKRRIANDVRDEKESEEQVPASSAALVAKDRIHRAVEAAKARNGGASRSDRVTQRRK